MNEKSGTLEKGTRYLFLPFLDEAFEKLEKAKENTHKNLRI